MRVALVAMMCACAAAPAKKRRSPAPVPIGRRPLPARVIVQRPELELVSVAPATDPHRPWPLSELPSLQPHLDAAMARDRCTDAWAARRTNAPELVAYGKAWCRIEAGDRGAVDELAKLAMRKLGDVSRAARLDVINLVTVGLDAAGAMRRLEHLGLDAPADFDLLAATFDALGMRDDARAVASRVMDADAHPTTRERCERVLAWGAVEEAVSLVADTDPCGRRAAAARCALARASDPTRTDIGGQLLAVRECYNEFPDDHAEERAWLLVTYFRWANAPMDTWITRARDACKAFGVYGAEELALAALDRAVVASDCDPMDLMLIAAAANRIAASEHHRPEHDAHVTTLRTMTAERCAAMHE